jgi:hypothetical protein
MSKVSGTKTKNLSFSTAEKVQRIEDKMNFKKEVSSIPLIATYVYDFDKHGGAQGDIVMDGPTLPKPCIITKAWAIAQTAPTEAGGPTAKITLEVKAADDLINSEAIATFAVDTPVALIPVGSAATMITMNTDGVDERRVQISIESADLTAGKIYVYVYYILPTK